MAGFRIPAILVLATWLLSGALGCSSLPFLKGDDEPPPVQQQFEDVKVPGELKIDRSNSFVFETQGFKAGTLYFTGYVDPDSVMDFFKAEMPRDGWRLKSIFRHPKTVLLFEKENKNCIVIIYESVILTHVEVWVAPQV
ncbi:MAG: hypothetical protein AB1896_02205 [Thermodesulfobacteriota bacterium]